LLAMLRESAPAADLATLTDRKFPPDFSAN
jgi:hypothetical protein